MLWLTKYHRFMLFLSHATTLDTQPPTHPSPARGEGEGDAILFNAFVLTSQATSFAAYSV